MLSLGLNSKDPKQKALNKPMLSREVDVWTLHKNCIHTSMTTEYQIFNLSNSHTLFWTKNLQVYTVPGLPCTFQPSCLLKNSSHFIIPIFEKLTHQASSTDHRHKTYITVWDIYEATNLYINIQFCLTPIFIRISYPII